jgi:hypothetical protein
MKGIFNGWLRNIYIYTPLEHQVQSLESLANPRTIAGYSWMCFFLKIN